MHLIADSGGTSISWALLNDCGAAPCVVTTPGYNAVSSADGLLCRHIDGSELGSSRLREDVESIEFYGAGCRGTEACNRVAEQLSSRFPKASVSIGSDMLGAARALLGNDKGVACILGTGSNSCYYNGHEIECNVPPMGFILGDEGSGAVLGRLLIGAVFKGLLPREVIDAFHLEFPEATQAEVIERVYRRPGAQAFLGSFAPFLSRHADVAEVRELVVGEFRRFFRNNVARYAAMGHDCGQTGFVGSVAVHFLPMLREAAAAEGFATGRVLESPLSGLIDRYCRGTGD